MHEPTWFTLRGGSQRAREARRYEGGTGARAVTMASSRARGRARPFRPDRDGREPRAARRGARGIVSRAAARRRILRATTPHERAAAHLLRLPCDQASVAWAREP